MKQNIKHILLAEVILATIAVIVYTILNFSIFQSNFIKYVILFAAIITILIILIGLMIYKFTNTKVKIVATILVIILFNFGLFNVYKLVNQTKSTFSAINDGSLYVTNIIVKKDSAIKDVTNFTAETKVGVQDLTNYEDGTFARENLGALTVVPTFVQYTSSSDAFNDLVEGNIDAMSIRSLDNEDLLKIDPNLKSNYNIIKTYTKKVDHKKEETNLNKPFAILISGVDTRPSTGLTISSPARSDSNIIVVVDPINAKITTLTTPRDSYVTLSCTGSVDKLTHAGYYGDTECIKNTLENLYDINISYTIKINFSGVIDVVDSLGGIDVKIPATATNEKFCAKGVKSGEQYCFTPGKTTTMNGKEALAFARDRYNQANGDFDRGRNQQIVIEAILSKAKTIKDFNTISNLLTATSQNVKTNITADELLILFNNFSALQNSVTSESIYISGSTGMRNNMSVVIPSTADIAYAHYRLEVALGLSDPLFPLNDYYVLPTTPKTSDPATPAGKQDPYYK